MTRYPDFSHWYVVGNRLKIMQFMWVWTVWGSVPSKTEGDLGLHFKHNAGNQKMKTHDKIINWRKGGSALSEGSLGVLIRTKRVACVACLCQLLFVMRPCLKPHNPGLCTRRSIPPAPAKAQGKEHCMGIHRYWSTCYSCDEAASVQRWAFSKKLFQRSKLIGMHAALHCRSSISSALGYIWYVGSGHGWLHCGTLEPHCTSFVGVGIRMLSDSFETLAHIYYWTCHREGPSGSQSPVPCICRESSIYPGNSQITTLDSEVAPRTSCTMPEVKARETRALPMPC